MDLAGLCQSTSVLISANWHTTGTPESKKLAHVLPDSVPYGYTTQLASTQLLPLKYTALQGISANQYSRT